MRQYLHHRFPRVTGWFGSIDLYELLAVLIVVGLIYGFIELAGEVSDGATQRFDEAVVRALRQPGHPDRPIGPSWAEGAMRDITALGSMAVLGIMTAAVVAYLFIRRLYHAAGFVLLATLGGLGLNFLLKHSFDRHRPTVVPHLSTFVTGSSFPSGHSMLSAIVYVTLGALLARFVGAYRLKVFLLTLGLLLTGLVGFSRVYLGVHYPTDVLAGWTAGLVWALCCWLLARYLQRRGAVEEVDEEDEVADAAG